jgi:S-formylglutathione hydrolase FrmB
MELNFTAELAQLLKFTGETAIAIRMYSAYSGGSPASYLGLPHDPAREAVDLMFLADALHHFTDLGYVLEEGKPEEVQRVCDRVLREFESYDAHRPEFGARQAKPTFDAWKGRVPLAEARTALAAIRGKAAAALASA